MQGRATKGEIHLSKQNRFIIRSAQARFTNLEFSRGGQDLGTRIAQLVTVIIRGRWPGPGGCLGFVRVVGFARSTADGCAA